MGIKTLECFPSVKTGRSLRKFSCSSVRLPSEHSRLSRERGNIHTMSTRGHRASLSIPSGENNVETFGSISTEHPVNSKVESLESGSSQSFDYPVENSTLTKTNSCTTLATSSRCDSAPLVTRRKHSRKFKKSSSDKLLKTVLKRNQDRVNRELVLKYSPEKRMCTRPETDHPLFKYTRTAEDVGYVSSSCISTLITRRLGGYALIDGRCPLAYRDSHIQGAVNLHTQAMLYDYYAANAAKPVSNVPAAVIFVSNDIYGESRRMASFFRRIDILVNKHHPSKLLFPRLYILNESYINFSKSFSGCCEAYI